MGDRFCEISMNGDVYLSYASKLFTDNNANGIAYDKDTDTIWVLCEKDWLYHFSKNGSLIDRYSFDYYAQDHITIRDGLIYATVGADYNGEKNYIVVYDPIEHEVRKILRTLQCYAIEGIVIGDNNEVWICNDGAYHNAKYKYSYIAKYITDFCF